MKKLFQGGQARFVQLFPGKLRIGEMPVVRRLPVNGSQQVELVHHVRRLEGENAFQRAFNGFFLHLSGAEGIHPDGNGGGVADGVGHLQFTLVRQPGGYDVFGDPAAHVRRGTVHLGRVLPGEGAAAVPGIAAVGVHNDFPAGEPGVGRRAALDEAPGGVDQDAYTFEAHVSEGRMQHMVHEGRHQIHLLHAGEMLSRDDDGFKAPGLPIGPVAHRDLRFAVREDKGDGPGFAGLCELVGQLIRKGAKSLR